MIISWVKKSWKYLTCDISTWSSYTCHRRLSRARATANKTVSDIPLKIYFRTVYTIDLYIYVYYFYIERPTSTSRIVYFFLYWVTKTTAKSLAVSSSFGTSLDYISIKFKRVATNTKCKFLNHSPNSPSDGDCI